MSNHNKGEIKTWNEGKPNIVGSSGALGLIGGIAGRAVKMLNFANIRSAVKQYVGKGGAAAQQSLKGSSIPKSVSKPPRKIGEFERRAAEYLNKRVSKGTATADDIKQLNIYNKRTNFGQR
tara:strand:+ start:158 stop:520 length:363 start_codon:yes stop_codon:yes gene_type:complete